MGEEISKPFLNLVASLFGRDEKSGQIPTQIITDVSRVSRPVPIFFDCGPRFRHSGPRGGVCIYSGEPGSNEPVNKRDLLTGENGEL